MLVVVHVAKEDDDLDNKLRGEKANVGRVMMAATYNSRSEHIPTETEASFFFIIIVNNTLVTKWNIIKREDPTQHTQITLVVQLLRLGDDECSR